MAKDKENGPTAIGSRAGELCECGHLLAGHVESGWGPNSVCVEPLDDESAGFHGVCPCVRGSWDVAA